MCPGSPRHIARHISSLPSTTTRNRRCRPAKRHGRGQQIPQGSVEGIVAYWHTRSTENPPRHPSPSHFDSIRVVQTPNPSANHDTIRKVIADGGFPLLPSRSVILGGSAAWARRPSGWRHGLLETHPTC